MRDFTQLMRRRLANRLTALSAGITALQELGDELSERERGVLLASLRRTASELEVAVLHPELARDGNGDGVLPRLDDVQLAELLVADVVQAEEHARSINERLVASSTTNAEQPVTFLCECWALECSATVTMPVADYWIVHARHDQFVIAPGHDLPAIEQVVERHGSDWWVVRKSPAALRIALDLRMQLLRGPRTGPPESNA